MTNTWWWVIGITAVVFLVWLLYVTKGKVIGDILEGLADILEAIIKVFT